MLRKRKKMHSEERADDTKFVVRMADYDDIGQVYNIEAQSFFHNWTMEQLLGSMNSTFDIIVLCIFDGQTAGYIIYSMVCEDADLLRIAVLPEYRRCGIAQRLISYMMYDCKAHHIQNIFLEVRKSNEAARNLYACMGFEQISVRNNYYSNPVEDGIVMKKENIDGIIKEKSGL